MDAVLRRTGGGTETGDDIATDRYLRASFIGGDAIFLEIVNRVGINGDVGDLTPAALDEDAAATLTTVKAGSEFEIADGGVANVARSILKGDAEEIGGTGGDAAVGAVDDETVDGDTGSVGNKKRDGERSGVKQTGGVLQHGRGHENGTVLSVDVEGLLDNDLLDVSALADTNFVARGSGGDGGLDGSVSGGGASEFVDIDEESLGGDWRGEECEGAEEPENSEKKGVKFHVIPLCESE